DPPLPGHGVVPQLDQLRRLVEFGAQDVAALGADLGSDLLRAVEAARVVEDDGGARPGEPAHDAFAEAARPAGDQHDLACKIRHESLPGISVYFANPPCSDFLEILPPRPCDVYNPVTEFAW